LGVPPDLESSSLALERMLAEQVRSQSIAIKVFV
jgi:hypothetical protein